MAAGATYEPIATQTLGSSSATITFSSIPATYTDLVLVGNSAFSSGANDMKYRLNGDTGSNYSETFLSGNGTSTFSGRTTSQTNVDQSAYATAGTTLGNQMTIVNFMNYSNTTTYKTSIGRAGAAANGTDAIVGLWRSTAAINTILVFIGGSVTFAAGTTFTLYGIKAA